MDNRYEHIKLFFNEKEHKYTDSLNNPYLSCTQFIHNYENPFKRDYWLRKNARELGISVKELSNNWKDITKESCDRGNNTHNKLEDGIKETSQFANAIRRLKRNTNGQLITAADLKYINVKPLDIKDFKEATDNKYPEIYRVFEYYLVRDYKIYSEIGVYLIDELVSGLVDVPVIREDQFVILDWKTNKDGIRKTAGYYKKDKSEKPYQLTAQYIETGDKLKAPLSHLDQCNGNIYTIQLSMYARMMEQMLGIPCAGLGLGHIQTPFILNKYGMPYRDERGFYKIDETKEEVVTWHRMAYRKDECEAMLNDRRLKLKTVRNDQLNMFN